MPLSQEEINMIYKQIGACQAWKESVDSLVKGLQDNLSDIREKIDCVYKRNNTKLSVKDIGYMTTISSVFLFELIKMLK